jgi:hypothetical protein
VNELSQRTTGKIARSCLATGPGVLNDPLFGGLIDGQSENGGPCLLCCRRLHPSSRIPPVESLIIASAQVIDTNCASRHEMRPIKLPKGAREREKMSKKPKIDHEYHSGKDKLKITISGYALSKRPAAKS